MNMFAAQDKAKPVRQSQSQSRCQLSGTFGSDENFLKGIITDDETWVYEYDVKMKMQSSQRVGKKFADTEKGAAGHAERESHVASFFF
jgi:hypothetical protein